MMRRGLRAVLVALALSLAVGGVGCEKDAMTLSAEGTNAMINKQYDKAVQSFEAALAKDPNSFDAVAGLAEVYGKKSDFAKARENFEKARKMDAPKGKLQYLEQRYQEMLLAEAEAAPDRTSAEYEKSLRAIVEADKTSPSANRAYTMLGEYYLERGKALEADKGTRAQAVEMYLQMKTIRTDAQQRKQALQRAKELQREVYKDEFAGRFNSMKEALVKEGRFDEATGRVKIAILKEDKEIVAPKDDAEKEGRAKPLQQGALKELVKVAYALAGVTVEDAELKVLQLASLSQDELVIEKGKEAVTMSASLEDMEEVTYKSLIVPARDKAAAGDAPKGEAPPKEEAPKEEAPPAPPTPPANP